MDLDEDDMRQALHGLEDKRLAGRARSADGRVTKYEHWLGEAFNFSRAETALVCVLLLRGPQTPGELRGRTERMHRFEEISDVLAGLQKLMEREPSLAVVLPRQPGTKESRYAHLLSGPVESIVLQPAALCQHARVNRRQRRRSRTSALLNSKPPSPNSNRNLSSRARLRRWRARSIPHPPLRRRQIFSSAPSGEAGNQDGRITQLFAALAQLRNDFENLKKRFDDLYA